LLKEVWEKSISPPYLFVIAERSYLFFSSLTFIPRSEIGSFVSIELNHHFDVSPLYFFDLFVKRPSLK
jgi:hypothetical protein